MPFDPDKFLKDTAPGGGQAFDPDEYLRTHPDPNRGALAKAQEFGRGEARGVVGNMLGLTHFLPGDELPFLPESARQARRGARADVEKFADSPDASGYETAGRITGREGSALMIPGGGRLAAYGTEKAVQAIPTLAQIVTLLHHPYLALLGHTALHRLGSRLQDLANAAAPLAGKVVGGATRLGEKIGGAEALNVYGRDDAQSPQDPGTQPAPSSSPVPSPPGSGPTRPTPRPSPRPDADTDAPVANRSGRGDRLPLYNPAAN